MNNHSIARWWAQNEAQDENFCLMNSTDHGERVFQAEREALLEMGAPKAEVDKIVFQSILPEDRDSAEVIAEVTPAMFQWLTDQDILVEN